LACFPPAFVGFFLELILLPFDEGGAFSRNDANSSEVHDVTTEKTGLFIITTEKISNPKCEVTHYVIFSNLLSLSVCQEVVQIISSALHSDTT
jgi:hypothetical protein